MRSHHRQQPRPKLREQEPPPRKTTGPPPSHPGGRRHHRRPPRGSSLLRTGDQHPTRSRRGLGSHPNRVGARQRRSPFWGYDSGHHSSQNLTLVLPDPHVFCRSQRPRGARRASRGEAVPEERGNCKAAAARGCRGCRGVTHVSSQEGIEESVFEDVKRGVPRSMASKTSSAEIKTPKLGPDGWRIVRLLIRPTLM